MSTEKLSQLPLFSSLEHSSLEQLASQCREKFVAAGQEIFAAGEKAEAFYLVLEGKVKIYKLSPRGDEQTLHTYGPGCAFGEAAVLSGKPYPAFAQALERSLVLEVARSTLAAAIRDDPELAMAMLAGLSGKLREFAHLIEQLALKEVPARLADALLRASREAGSNSFELDLTKRQLASQIGTVAETLSRALKKLRKEGLIEVEGSHITILDREALEVVARAD